MDPNTPSPSKQDGILKIKESELLVQIRTIVTEVIRKEFLTKITELENRVANADLEIEGLKATQSDFYIESNSQLKDLKQDLKRSKDQNNIMQEELLRNELQRRKLNLKFSNVIDKQGETSEECEWNFLQMLKKSDLALGPLCITRAYRIGTASRDRPHRAMIVSFHHPKQRNYILNNSLKLWQTRGVIVEEDFLEEIQLRRKMLIPSF